MPAAWTPLMRPGPARSSLDPEIRDRSLDLSGEARMSFSGATRRSFDMIPFARRALNGILVLVTLLVLFPASADAMQIFVRALDGRPSRSMSNPATPSKA